MATIRLENVTRVFSRDWTNRQSVAPGRGQGVLGGKVDRAFAERAASQARQEADGRSSDRGDSVALDHVHLTIPDGQTFALVGPSGCGKSTLLRVVAGLDGDYSGDIYYDAQDMRYVPPKDRFIGMVFQNYALYPHFEGRGNLSFFFRVRKAPSAEAEERIRVTSQIMGLGFDQLLDRRPGVLSGGQQQRLAIGRAIVRNPRLFLFDEPLSNLDAKLRAQTRVEIKRLLHRFAITAIYVTHDQDEALSLGDQIAIMREGKIEQVGTFADLQDDPANAFVASFLGRHAMNLFAAEMTDDGRLRLCDTAPPDRGTLWQDPSSSRTIADSRLPIGDFRSQIENRRSPRGKLALPEIENRDSLLPIPAPLAARYRPGERLTVGIRPEAARLAAGEPPSPECAHMQGEVHMVEPDLAHHRLVVMLRTGSSLYAVVGDPERWPRVGERVDVLLPVDRLYYFDGATGQRVVV